MAIYGYARVSAKDQLFNSQIYALNQAACVAEKISEAGAHNRKGLARALRALAPGDTLVVTRLDRQLDQLAICSTRPTMGTRWCQPSTSRRGLARPATGRRLDRRSIRDSYRADIDRTRATPDRRAGAPSEPFRTSSCRPQAKF